MKKKHAEQEDAKRKREVHQEVHRKFQKEFWNRQKAIGKIVCPQCEWTGNWGDEMSYQEFFAYELYVKHKVPIDETLIRDADAALYRAKHAGRDTVSK